MSKFIEIFDRTWNNVIAGIIAGLIIVFYIKDVDAIMNSSIWYKSFLGIMIFISALIFNAIYAFIKSRFKK